MSSCSVRGCQKAASKRGWCNAHYLRWIRRGDPEAQQPNARWMQIDVDWLRAEYEAGRSVRDIAAELALSHPTVRKALVQAGIPRREFSIGDATRTHGLSHEHPLYVTWKSMHQRCSNSNDPRFRYYGARGISVCAEWTGEGGFEAFLDHVLKLSHYGEAGRTLDRWSDNDGDYEPGNVRWATHSQQMRNRRRKV